MQSGQLKLKTKKPKWRSSFFPIAKQSMQHKGQKTIFRSSGSIDELALKVFLIKGLVTGSHPRFDRLVKTGQLKAHPNDIQLQSEEEEESSTQNEEQNDDSEVQTDDTQDHA